MKPSEKGNLKPPASTGTTPDTDNARTFPSSVSHSRQHGGQANWNMQVVQRYKGARTVKKKSRQVESPRSLLISGLGKVSVRKSVNTNQQKYVAPVTVACP